MLAAVEVKRTVPIQCAEKSCSRPKGGNFRDPNRRFSGKLSLTRPGETVTWKKYFRFNILAIHLHFVGN